MGLDLVCGTECVSMPYSYVQQLRVYWVQAYIQWRRDQPGLPNKRLQECIRQVLDRDGSTKLRIDYNVFGRINVDCDILEGLVRFVDHSDCDGRWTHYDARHIMTTLTALVPYLRNLSPRDFDGDNRYLLHTILLGSVRSREDILFQ